MKLLIKNGRIINPAVKEDEVLDILIENGNIQAIGKDLDGTGCEVLDANGLIVTPGLIDMHVHLREPGLEAKEDIYTGTRSAAAGGFTTVACMPNTKPVIDQSIFVSGIQERAKREGVVNVKVIGALSKNQEGKELAEIGDMILNGAVAISDDGHFVEHAGLFKAALEYTNMFGCPVISHAEDESLVSDGFMHEGTVSAMLGIKGRPAVAEDIAVARDILLAEYTGTVLHIAHVSTKGAVELIKQAKARGVRVTAEVTPHHLALSDEAVIDFDTATKVNPPLRSNDHIEALKKGLQDGTIDVLATDHSPHAYEEKDQEFRYAPSGFPGLETAVGVLLTELYHSGELPLMKLIECMTVAPARILGIDAGEIKIGKSADLTLIDLDYPWTVNSKNFYSKAQLTPFEGRKLRGKTVYTIVGGKIVMQNGKVQE